jgi:hypothetical protein
MIDRYQRLQLIVPDLLDRAQKAEPQILLINMGEELGEGRFVRRRRRAHVEMVAGARDQVSAPVRVVQR